MDEKHIIEYIRKTLQTTGYKPMSRVTNNKNSIHITGYLESFDENGGIVRLVVYGKDAGKRIQDFTFNLQDIKSIEDAI
jgi:hypothetical protein